MQVIPSINESSFEEVSSRVRRAESFLPSDGWVHIDIADGVFTKHTTWNNPVDMKILATALNIELHLMVQEPESVLAGWLQALSEATTGAKRVIVHYEAMTDPSYILEMCARYGAEAGLAINPMTSSDLVSVYLRDFKFCQILAVTPGPGGQSFQESSLYKIKSLKEKFPNVIIEVDGGMNKQTAYLVKNAGADIVVAGTFIFDSPAPGAMYEELKKI